MKKFYLFLIVLSALIGGNTAFAQDSAGCNASFQAFVSGNTVFFQANDSAAGVVHNWNFGDGSTKVTDSASVTHTYATFGTYVVSQIVTDSIHQCRDSSGQSVNVQAPPPACSVYITETSDTAHHQYTFIANASFTPGASDSVSWMINDTLVGTGDTLQKTLLGGPYNVCALLSTSYSCQAQSCITINPQDSIVTPPPPPPDTCTIAINAVQKHKPNQYEFSVVNSGDYNSITWSIMGSDSLSAGHNGPNFVYTFPDTGYYTIYVTAEKVTGCFVSNLIAIDIDSIPQHGNTIASFPNPATTQVTLTVTLDKYTNVNVQVYNSMGGVVLSRSVSGYPGTNQVTLPIANLPTGVYYIELQYGDTILRSKVQKL